MGKEMEQLWNEQMKELLISQLRQIKQDEDWISQIVNVDSMRKLGLLLKEKQIHPEEFKRALAAAALKNSNRTLTDQQLESVSGGGYESLCTKQFSHACWGCEYFYVFGAYINFSCKLGFFGSDEFI